MFETDLNRIARQRKLLEAMTGQVISPVPNQVIGNTVVPYGIGEGFTRLAQALLAKKGMTSLDTQQQDIQNKMQQGTSGATNDIINMMMGKPNYSDQGPQIPVTPNPVGAMISASTNPYLSSNPALQTGLQKIITARMMADKTNNQRSPYYTFFSGTDPKTGETYLYSGNARSGDVNKVSVGDFPINQVGSGINPTPEQQSNGTPLFSPQYNPTVKGKIKGAEKTAEEQVKRNFEAGPAAAALSASLAPLQRMSDTVNEIITSPGLEMRTGLTSYAPAWLEGAEARNTQAKIANLRSQVAQNVLQMYRDMSKTGGAVGQVSNFEQKMFEDNLAALDQAQTKEEFIKQMRKIDQFISDSEVRLKTAYELTYSNPNISIDEITSKIYKKEAAPAPKTGNVIRFDAQGNMIQ